MAIEKYQLVFSHSNHHQSISGNSRKEFRTFFDAKLKGSSQFLHMGQKVRLSHHGRGMSHVPSKEK
jgi:hypothetical protein